MKGEVYIRIGQNLMALPGQRLEDIREVRTHYMAINQTRPWFEKNAPWIKLTESEDTAKSAAELARVVEVYLNHQPACKGTKIISISTQ